MKYFLLRATDPEGGEAFQAIKHSAWVRDAADHESMPEMGAAFYFPPQYEDAAIVAILEIDAVRDQFRTPRAALPDRIGAL